jgi:uncharacterized membrane protein YagU involved in acid resistance
MRRGRSGAGAAILWGGLIAGAIDILVACITNVMHGGQPMKMLQGIAYALIGMGAFKGGLGTAALGLVLHFVIAFGAAAAYVLVSRRLSVMVREPVVCGLLYGVPVWLVTNFIIVPMSRIGHALPGSPGQSAIGLMVLMIGVGLPIALMTRRYAG